MLFSARQSAMHKCHQRIADHSLGGKTKTQGNETMTKRNIDDVLAELKIELPEACKAAGNYRPVVSFMDGRYLIVSGHTPNDARPEGFAVGKVAGTFASPDTVPGASSGKQLGTVKWFNATKGYGFIQPDAGGKDVFVHVSEVERAGLTVLKEGQKIEFETSTVRGKTAAVGLALPGSGTGGNAIPAGLVTPKQAYDAARDVGLAILASVKAALGGDLNRVKRLVEATGVVNAVAEFTEHAKVINGFSDLMAQVFGEENGIGARSATGAASLPDGVPVEITRAVFEVEVEHNSGASAE